MDKFTCTWCAAEMQLKKEIYTLDAQQLYQRLKSLQYEYLVIDVTSIKMIAGQQNSTPQEAEKYLNTKIADILDSGNFIPIHSVPNGAGILKLK